MSVPNCIDTLHPFSSENSSCTRRKVTRAHLFARLLHRLRDWRERARSRHLLQQLDDRMLRDVGLTRSDIERECAKPFWQP